jgi:hypothetical protein
MKRAGIRYSITGLAAVGLVAGLLATVSASPAQANTPVRLTTDSLTLGINSSEDFIEFPHRPGAPQGRERLLGRQLEQEVPLEAGHQHARVEYRSIHGVTPLDHGTRYGVSADQGLRRTSAR